MELALTNAARLGLLLVPTALGALFGMLRVFPNPRAAIDALNIYALYVAFPALIVAGLLDTGFSLPTAVGFWLFVPVWALLIAAPMPLAARLLGRKDQAGSAALVAVWGNFAYLGLPLCIEVFGDEIRGLASLIVAIYVGVAVILGPTLLALWSGGRMEPRRLLGVVRQPLLWAPIIGLAASFLPPSAQSGIGVVVEPLGATAAPVALFLLGLYLWVQRSVVLRPDRGVWLHVGARLLLGPLLAAGMAIPAARLGWLPADVVPMLVLLAGMPAAISTFAIAHEQGIGSDRVASTIVISTLLSLVTLPLLATWSGWL